MKSATRQWKNTYVLNKIWQNSLHKHEHFIEIINNIYIKSAYALQFSETRLLNK